jgi:putative DNA primase/helicase
MTYLNKKFAEACAKADAASADNAPSEQEKKVKEANDWLADFAKKSQEALAERAAAKKVTPAPDERVLVEALARKDHTEYDKVRSEVAETLGVRVGTLDDKVEALRKKIEVESDQDTLPHWRVEPWSEPVDGAELLNSIKQVLRRYIVLPKDADTALALWVLHAWTMDAGDISPFMVLVSPTKRCGKTSALILLYFLTPKSELASNISAAALFRYIEAVRPTLLIDEADSFAKDNEELRGVLNSGHTRVAANVIRTVEVNGEHKPRRFSTWAPKAIATIRGLADTLEDRSVIVGLQRKPRGAKVERLRRRDTEEFRHLRSQAARWAADNFDKLTDPNPKMPEILNDRAADNWRQLLAVAELAGGTWPEEAHRAALTLSGEEQDGAINVELLRDIRSAFGDADAMRSADLVTKLAADPERPWADWKRGRPLTQKQLGALLRPFCITSETVSLPGYNDAKGYRRSRFEEAWAVYCPSPSLVKTPLPAASDISKRRSVGMPVESAQVADFRSVAEGPGDGSKNGKLSYSHAGSDASTLRKTQNGGQGGSDQENLWVDLGIIEPLRRCDHCGQSATAADPLNPWDWPGRPDGLRLHRRCEGPWFDRAAAADNHVSNLSPIGDEKEGRWK